MFYLQSIKLVTNSVSILIINLHIISTTLYGPKAE